MPVMTCLNLSVSTLLKLHFRRKYIKHPKHIQDIQLNTSDMLAATHIELSHTNSNIFATFNEWINLAEQKKCSKKGPLGSNFCTKKKKKSISRRSTVLLSQNSSIQTCTLLLQFRYPFSFSPFL